MTQATITPFRPPPDDPYWENDPPSPYFPGYHEECGNGPASSFEEDPTSDSSPPGTLTNSFEEGLDTEQFRDILLQHGAYESNNHIHTLQNIDDLQEESSRSTESPNTEDKLQHHQAMPVGDAPTTQSC